MIDWLFRHRPGWVGAIARIWFANEWLPMPGSWAPIVLGLWLGSRGHRVADNVSRDTAVKLAVIEAMRDAADRQA